MALTRYRARSRRASARFASRSSIRRRYAPSLRGTPLRRRSYSGRVNGNVGYNRRVGAVSSMPVYAAPGKVMHYYDMSCYDNSPGVGLFQPIVQAGPVPLILNLLDGTTASGPQAAGFTGSALTNGDGLNNFTGTKIFLHRVLIRGDLILPTTAGRGNACLCIVYDRAPRGVVPTVADIFDQPDIYALQRVQYRSRFEIVYRRYWNMDSTGTGVGAGLVGVNTTESSHAVVLDIPVNRVANCGQGGNTFSIANVVDGALYMVWLGTGVGIQEAEPFTTSNCPMTKLRTRVLFHAYV